MSITTTLSWEQLHRAALVTNNVSAECAALGRCMFSSVEAMLSVVDCSDGVDDTVLQAWTSHHLVQDASASLPPVVVPSIKAEEVTQNDNTTITTTTTTRTWTEALTTAGVLLIAPAKWTAVSAWGWASWAVGGTVSFLGRGSRGTATSSTGSADVVFSSHHISSSLRSERKGVIFLPALHRLCLGIAQDLGARHPYNAIFTEESWEDYLLDRHVRNADIVTEFLCSNGIVQTAEDSKIGVRCFVFVESLAVDTAKRESELRIVAQLIRWLGLCSRVHNAVTQWDTELQELTDLGSSDADRQRVEGNLAQTRLIDIQMMKLHDALGGSGMEVSLADCLVRWDEMMEHFPEVWDLLPQFPSPSVCSRDSAA